MAALAVFAKGNHLLGSLSAVDFALLKPSLRPAVLRLRLDLEKPNKRIDDIYFPDTGIASVVALHPNGNRVEIGVIGCEGMTGAAVMLGGERSPHETYIQVAGAGQSISVAAFRKSMDASRTLNALTLRFVQAFMVQTAHTAVANARARLSERLARWLLMAHDRIPGDDLALTHEFLSLMMGVRRAGVTEALQHLTQLRLIRAKRGIITLLNRKGIEAIAGTFYGIPEAEYRRLIVVPSGRSWLRGAAEKLGTVPYETRG